MLSHIMVGGLDGSMKNFAVAKMWIDITDPSALSFQVHDLILTQTEKAKNKQVRASSDLFRRAKEVHQGAVLQALTGCSLCFAEIPSGGQSYDAVIGFGITIGIYASIPIPLVEVSPTETKLHTVGTKTASKQEMIEWAFATYPTAPWILHERNGAGFKKGEPTLANEHLADACAVVHAGVKTPQFNQTLSMLRATARQAA